MLLRIASAADADHDLVKCQKLEAEVVWSAGSLRPSWVRTGSVWEVV